MTIKTSNDFKRKGIVSQLSNGEFKQFLSEIEIIKCNKNEYIIYKDQPQHYFYIIISGRLSVYISDNHKPNKVIKVASFVENDICGEMSLFSANELATADVVADEDCILMKISHDISNQFKLQLVSSVYEKVRNSNDKIILYDNKINKLIHFVRLKSLAILVLFIILNFKFIVTASFSDIFLSLFWALPIVSTLTTVAIVIFFQKE